jgi:hypothetical protein
MPESTLSVPDFTRPSLKVPKKNAHKFERERGSSWTGTGEAEAYDRQELKGLPEGSNYFI